MLRRGTISALGAALTLVGMPLAAFLSASGSSIAAYNYPPPPPPPPPPPTPMPPPAPQGGRLSTLSVNPISVFGGTSVRVDVTLTAAAPTGGSAVALRSSNPVVVQVPANLTIPQGTTTGSLTVATTRVRGDASVDIIASLDGDTRTATLQVSGPRSRIAVFRPSTGDWMLRGDDGSPTVVRFGNPGDVPVPADYDGRGLAQIAVYRPSTSEWLIRQDNGSALTVSFGVPGDLPVPADYLGLGHVQIAVFRPSEGQWYIRGSDGNAVRVLWGKATDILVPGDYVGDGRAQVAVYRPGTGEWLIRSNRDGSQMRVLAGGLPGDTPVPEVYDGTGRTRVAYYRPADQTWGVWGLDGTLLLAVRFGDAKDTPVPADYLGLGRAQLAVYRPGTNEWIFHNDRGADTRIQWGSPGDRPISAAFAPRFDPPSLGR